MVVIAGISNALAGLHNLLVGIMPLSCTMLSMLQAGTLRLKVNYLVAGLIAS